MTEPEFQATGYGVEEPVSVLMSGTGDLLEAAARSAKLAEVAAELLALFTEGGVRELRGGVAFTPKQELRVQELLDKRNQLVQSVVV
jgi:hypothetical protein